MIGGSSAAAACGVDPFKSRVQLWLELTGRVEREPAGETAEWGNRLEPVIVAEVERQGFKTVYGGLTDAAMPPRSPELPEWFTGTPDGFVGINSHGNGRGLLEIKTAGLRMAPLWADGEIPIPYQIQCQHYLELTGLDWGLIACLIGGQRLELREFERNPELIARMIELETEFVGMVERDEAPPPDGSKSAEAMLRLMYPVASGEVVVFTNAQMEEVEKAKSLRKALKATELQLAGSEQKIKSWIGDAPAAFHEGRKVVNWGTVTPKAPKINGATIKEKHPEVFEECSYLPAPYRRFEVK